MELQVPNKGFSENDKFRCIKNSWKMKHSPCQKGDAQSEFLKQIETMALRNKVGHSIYLATENLE